MQKNGTTRTLQTVKDADGAVTSRVRRTVLPSGLRVVTEHMAGVRSASIGVWVGGRLPRRDAGAARLLALPRAPALQGHPRALGDGHLRRARRGRRRVQRLHRPRSTPASTRGSSTRTCRMAVDVLGDMITSSTHHRRGRRGRARRDPRRDRHARRRPRRRGAQPVRRARPGATPRWAARSPAPTSRSRRSPARRSSGFYRRHYRPENMVVAVAGNVDHADVVRQVRQAFGRNGFLDGDGRPVPAAQSRAAPACTPGEVAHLRPFEQVNVVLGMQGLTRSDPRRYALGVLNTALGGGTSSRLFQEVRERRGLAYSVYSFASHHADAGLVGVSVGCLPSKLDDVLARSAPSSPRSRPSGLTEEEVERGKGQLAAAWCSASRTPARGCRASARPSSSTTSCSPSTRSSPASRPSPLEDVRARRRALHPARAARGRRGRAPRRSSSRARNERGVSRSCFPTDRVSIRAVTPSFLRRARYSTTVLVELRSGVRELTPD